MITKASFRNFKALKSVDIDLRRLTIIVGPNGSGKSSILEGIHILCQRATNPRSPLFDTFDKYQAVHTRGAQGIIEIRVSLSDREIRLQSFDGNLSERALEVDLLEHVRSYWQMARQQGRTEVVSERRINVPNWLEETLGMGRPLIASRLLRLDPSRLREPSYLTKAPPLLAANGQGLASVVAYCRGRYPELFQRIENGLRKLIPTVKQVKSDRVAISRTVQSNGQQIGQAEEPTVTGDSLLFDFVGADDVPAESASEGTLIVLAILTELMSAKGPMVLLLDNLDHGLHPQAQFELIKLIRSLLESNPDLQIIGTAHSPYILEQLDAKEILITSIGSDGAASCARVSDHPDFDKWKDAMTPGEFWSHVGEDWITKREFTGAVP